MQKRIAYRLLLLGLSVLVIPAVPIFIIFLGTSSPEYVINGTLNMSITDELHPFGLYFESLKNLLTLNLGTSTASGLPVVHEVLASFIESFKIMLPALAIGLLFGLFFFYWKPLNRRSRPILDWICFVPMVVFSYLSLFLLDKMGFDVTSNVRFFLAAIILSIYPSYIIYHSFAKQYSEILGSEYYQFHLASGFPSNAILRRFLPKYFLIEFLSIFESIFIYMFGFLFFVESPMAINGAGNQFVWSIQRYDYPMIIGYCIFSIILLTVINVVTDTLLLRIDKRR